MFEKKTDSGSSSLGRKWLMTQASSSHTHLLSNPMTSSTTMVEFNPVHRDERSYGRP
jgi:hypothetical protein